MTVDWHKALDEARRGKLEAAGAARAACAGHPMDDYFHGRCLAEAGQRLDEAIESLTRAINAEPANPIYLQTMALARIQQNTPDGARMAHETWRIHGLPHDIDLLGGVALSIEDQVRPLPHEPEGKLPAWPASLSHPVPAPLPEETEKNPGPETAATRELKFPGQDNKNTTNPPRAIRRRVSAIERLLMRHRSARALEGVVKVMTTGYVNAEIHLLGGIAAEEVGDAARARAHLSQALTCEPSLHMARLYLGRVWWRMGWTGQAVALWRTLPIEGPIDNGRHYFLALGHAALDDRPAALGAMRVALVDFFYDTRHFFIERSLYRWRLHWRLPTA